jgi:hypothetical protein
MDSIDKNDDLELLAALLDGKLSGAEREKAVKLLADSDDALELFASAARDERLAAEPPRRVIPIRRQWKIAIPIAAAAAITLGVFPRLVGLGGNAASASELAVAVLSIPGGRGGAGAYLLANTGWEQRGWPQTRGAGGARGVPAPSQKDSVEASRRVFRLGVRTVDLMVALRSGDTAAARHVTDDIIQTLDEVDLSGPVKKAYSELERNLRAVPIDESIKRASKIEPDLRHLVNSSVFENAQWMGAAELASRAHDASFFESKKSARFVQSKMTAGTKDSAETLAFRYVDSTMKRGLTESALTDMQTVLERVIQRQVSGVQ